MRPEDRAEPEMSIRRNQNDEERYERDHDEDSIREVLGSRPETGSHDEDPCKVATREERSSRMDLRLRDHDAVPGERTGSVRPGAGPENPSLQLPEAAGDGLADQQPLKGDRRKRPRVKSGRYPGFRWDPKTKTAYFEFIVPGTGSKIRHRESRRYESYDQALKGWSKFRTGIVERRARGDVLTFKQFVDSYWDTITKGLKPSGKDADRYRLDAIILPAIGHLPLDKITAAVVGDLVRDQKIAGKMARTINGYVKIIGKILHEAVRREEIPSFPVKGRLPHLKEQTLRLEMTVEEQREYLAAFEDEQGFRMYIERTRSRGTVATSPHFGGNPRSFGGGRKPDGAAAGYHYDRFRASKPFFVVGIEAGLRRGDLLSLRWEAVDLDRNVITLTTSKCEIPVEIPISSVCRRALEECLARTVVGEHVFLNDKGQPYSEKAVSRYHKIAKELAAITRRLRIHDLRHTFGSNLSSLGVPVQMIAKTMGHTSTRMTEKYARPDAEVTRSVVAQALETLRERVDAGENELLRELPAPRKLQPRLRGAANPFECMMLNGGADGARTRDLRRDRPAF